LEILYLLQIISPTVGGGEALFHNFAKSMMQKGHRVNIICYELKVSGSTDLKRPGLDMSDLEKEGANIYKVKPAIEDKGGVLLSYSQQFGYIFNAFRKGLQILRRGKIDIIHANTYTPVIPAFLLGKMYRIPVISTVHHVALGHWKLWASQAAVRGSTSFIGPLYEKFILKLPVDAVHVVSCSTKIDLLKVNPNAKTNVIYNGIDLGESIDTNKENGVNDQRFILYIGRLVVTKNLEVVILAFERVARTFPDAKLIIVGDGPMRTPWEDLTKKIGLSENIIFMGHISTGIKNELLRSCTALVLPSKLEGFGRVIIEAFGTSKPVLVADTKVESEIVDDGIDGFLIPPDDVEGWASKIEYLFSNKERCLAMGRNGRDKVEKKFDLNLISNKLEEFYKQLVFGPKSS
jgi:glycosyltransferase involved in cell wall biosynthesis